MVQILVLSIVSVHCNFSEQTSRHDDPNRERIYSSHDGELYTARVEAQEVYDQIEARMKILTTDGRSSEPIVYAESEVGDCSAASVLDDPPWPIHIQDTLSRISRDPSSRSTPVQDNKYPEVLLLAAKRWAARGMKVGEDFPEYQKRLATSQTWVVPESESAVVVEVASGDDSTEIHSAADVDLDEEGDHESQVELDSQIEEAGSDEVAKTDAALS
ncbi:hypothetical protein BST61_g11212 [Cercospora zeina]